MGDEFWGEPISVYTDQEALEDGVLVDISGINLQYQGKPINRMARALYAHFEPFLMEQPERRFTFQGIEIVVPSQSKIDHLRQITQTKLRFARLIGAGCVCRVWLPPNLWMLENEVGGWSLILPSND